MMDDQNNLDGNTTQDNEQTTVSKEEFNKRLSDKDREYNKVKLEKDNYDRAMQEITTVAQDQSHLLKLHNENPKVAQIILDKVYNGISIDELKERIGYKDDQETVDSKKLDALVDQKLAQKEVNKAVKNFSSNLSDDEKEKFEAEFKELTDGKKLNADNVSKYINLAYTEAVGIENIRDVNNAVKIAKIMGTGTGKPEASKADPMADPKIKAAIEYSRQY